MALLLWLPGIALALALALGPAAGRAEPALPRDLRALDSALGDALALYQSGDYEAAVAAVERIVLDLEALPASAEAEAQWSRALLRLAHARATLGRAEASREAMEKLLAVEGAVVPDPELYSPSFRREFERARARVEGRPRQKLKIASTGRVANAAVWCRPLGPTPAEVVLPAGRYRVSAASGEEKATATVDLLGGRTVELPLPAPAAAPPVGAAEEALAPDPVAPPTPEQKLGSDVSLSVSDSAEAQLENGSRAWTRPAGLVTASLALVSAGVAVWQGVALSQAASEVHSMVLPDGSLAPGTDPESYAAALDRYGTARRNVWIAGGAAAALSLGAALLLFLPRDLPIAPSPDGAAVHF